MLSTDEIFCEARAIGISHYCRRQLDDILEVGVICGVSKCSLTQQNSWRFGFEGFTF